MSINVTVHSNPVNIRRGRMILSDLNQIKKNERDRRRRLRLEQVRQQSKEISNRLVGRVKNAAKHELDKLANDNSSKFKKLQDKKIMEMQQKYQEDMADFGLAHTCALMESDPNEAIEEDNAKNRIAALKRGKEAMQELKETKEQIAAQQQAHQEHLRQVRELENLRSSMVAQLAKKSADAHTAGTAQSVENESNNVTVNQKLDKSIMEQQSRRKTSSPGKLKTHPKVARSDKKLEGQSVPQTNIVSRSEETENTTCVTVQGSCATSSNLEKSVRYNPEDYVEQSSESTATDSPGTVSDDSSYFSDNSEQFHFIQTPKYVPCPGHTKVRMYDHLTRQRKEYTKPIGVVEKIDVRNEPSAIDIAKEIQEMENTEKKIEDECRCSAQRRGEDAILREKVRRDYQTLLQNLDQISREERKLKASQIQRYPRDPYLREERRKILREQHKRRLNNAMKSVINQISPEKPCGPVERIITITPRNNEGKEENVPRAVWQSSSHNTDVEAEGEEIHEEDEAIEKSREEQILDMLKKVERQKKLLLEEFGAELPSDIINASMKPLFEQQPSTSAPQNTPREQAVSPEIRVINMSSCCEENQEKSKERRVKSPVKKVETAVQTAAEESKIAEDKGVQVEEISLRPKVSSHSNSSDTDIETSNNYGPPLEPKITVLNPQQNSSGSSNSTITGVHIDIDDENVKVTPKKKKLNSKSTKRIPSKLFQKSRSMPGSKMSTPTKRFSRSLPNSCRSSPAKQDENVARTPTKKIDIYVNKNGLNIRVEPSPRSKMAVDASTQSTQEIGFVNVEEHSSNKPYRIQSKMKRVIKIKDTSDTSTSYASLPPLKPRSLIETFVNNTPILEMLDSSANETLRRLKGEISPVSTPETPSPRTMMLPSNIPRPTRISKVLNYDSAPTQTNHNSILSINKNDQSISTDASDYLSESRRSEQYPVTSSRVSLVTNGLCSCKNPECQLLHGKFDEIHDFALKNCPEILQKYEDLQHMCSERIASLTDLIERVRSEQKGVEISMISPGDETSYMELPSLKSPVNNELQSVHKLVRSIEAIHNQLARTLTESQKIMKNGVIPREQITKEEAINVPGTSTSENRTNNLESKIEKPLTKSKPKIVNDEKVNIHLKNYKLQHKSQIQQEDVIEKLSKEILEQSTNLTKTGTTLSGFKETNVSLTKRTIQKSVQQDKSKNHPDTHTGNHVSTTQESSSSNSDRNSDEFVPFLAGIPKVPRTSAGSTSARTKPPVTLHSGPFRSEIESSGHELSTIVEHDTPDTVNKSQHLKSPSPVKRSTETQAVKPFTTPKPSVHVAPLHTLHNENLKVGISQSVQPTKSQGTLLATNRSQEIPDVTSLPEKSEVVGKHENFYNEQSELQPLVLEKNDKKLQCGKTNWNLIPETEDLQLLFSEKLGYNNQYKSNKDKLTSSSSNSFSGLSGISEITSTPSSELQKYASSPEEMETALQKLGLGWAITILKKTRAASALSSSSNSDITPINTARRILSPPKKHSDSNACNLPDFSDVSSISIKEASKSTEQAVLLKGRTSTPKLQNSNSNSAGTNSTSTSSSGNIPEHSDSIIVPHITLTKVKPNTKMLENL